MDKSYIEQQHHLAVLDFKTAKTQDEKWEARMTLSRLEELAAIKYGFAYADELHDRELGRGKENENNCIAKQQRRGR